MKKKRETFFDSNDDDVNKRPLHNPALPLQTRVNNLRFVPTTTLLIPTTPALPALLPLCMTPEAEQNRSKENKGTRLSTPRNNFLPTTPYGLAYINSFSDIFHLLAPHYWLVASCFCSCFLSREIYEAKPRSSGPLSFSLIHHAPSG